MQEIVGHSGKYLTELFKTIQIIKTKDGLENSHSSEVPNGM